jgi:hypothetical protein
MANGRCKFHGGKSTGPRTAEGLAGSKKSNWKHGRCSQDIKAQRARVRAAVSLLRHLARLFQGVNSNASGQTAYESLLYT